MSVNFRPQISIRPREVPIDVGHELNLSNVATPSEVVQEDGYFIKSYSVQLKYVEVPLGVELVLSRYYPTNALSIGFDIFYLIDKSTNKPVVMNDLIVEHIERFSFENFSGLVVIDKENRFRGLSGHLDNSCVIKVSWVIFQTYDLWKEFPNEKSMESVKKMHKIRDMISYESVQIEEQERNIIYWRSEISSLKESIKESEDNINKAYEEMASNIDVLESHGYKYDFNEKRKKLKSTYVDAFSYN